MTALTHPILSSTLLLAASNIFMTFAWYGHLNQEVKMNYLYAGLCLVGACYFIFRG